jgi:hypothetical protein
VLINLDACTKLNVGQVTSTGEWAIFAAAPSGQVQLEQTFASVDEANRALDRMAALV